MYFATRPASNYTLTVLVNGSGTITKSPDAPFYTNNTGVIVFATPNAGQVFTGWTGSTNSSTVYIKTPNMVHLPRKPYA